MKDYSAMSDGQINKSVHDEQGFTDNDEVSNYCNNPADAWPIIVASNISLHAPRYKEGWMSEFTGGDSDVNDGFHADYLEAHDKNPLRAAMIVYLMMKDAE